MTTNRDFLVTTLRHHAFLAGDTTTAISSSGTARRASAPAENEVRAAALAVALTAQHDRRRSATLMRTLPSGWRNNPSQMQQTAFTHQGEEVKTGYLVQRDGSFAYEVAGTRGVARLHRVDGETVDIEVDGSRRVVAVTGRGSQFWVQGPSGEVQLTELPRFPDTEQEEVAGGYAAPMPGKVISIHVEPGDTVSRGELMLVMEAMKMEHRITCVEEHARVTEVRVAKGEQVDAGQMLVVVEGTG